MANLFINLIHKGRFLIVGALVMALTTAPFMSSAGSGSSTVSVTADNSIAGLSSEIDIENANPYTSLEVLVTKPSGNQVVLEIVSDENGNADLTLSDYHLREAGDYTVEARHSGKNEKFGRDYSFEVKTGTVSITKSTAELSKNTANKGETVELTVTLQDKYGNPIYGHFLQVISTKNSDNIYSPNYLTDEDGEMNFYISSDSRGISEFTIIDTSVNKTLATRPKLAFLTGDEVYKEVGGWSNNFASVILAQETSGPLDSFKITGLTNSVGLAESKTITVTALDAEGFTVTDYTGEIRFSSTDDAATLPNDYIYIADDQGEHKFSLAVKFVTPGDQSLTVTDINQFNITGESTFEVVTVGEIGEDVIEVESDFETEEFEREGDFTLISPASGTYSNNEIQIQGEADYGFSVVIYLNEEEAGRQEVEFDNSFVFTLEDVDDGVYDVYVDIVELGVGDPGEEEIIEIIETSDVEEVIIDTSAPELVAISTKPEGAVAPGAEIEFTVLSEADLEEVSILLDDEIFELTETNTSGKYQVTAIAPEDEGEVAVDVILIDELGNEVQYRDQLILTVSAEEAEADEVEDDEDLLDGTTGSGTGDPGSVTGLTGTPGEGEITISWESAPEGENAIAFYRVYYGPAPDALFATSDTFDSSTTWFIPSLEAGAIYYMAVSAIDVEGQEGPQSGIISLVPLAKAGTEQIDEFVPTVSTDPAITSTGTPGETPDSGPATNLMIGLSLALAFAYINRKKLATQNV